MNYSFCLVVDKTIHHEGDERSRQCPEHGYPAYTETFLEFVGFTSESALLKAIEDRRRYGQQSFTAYVLTPLSVHAQITVSLQPKP